MFPQAFILAVSGRFSDLSLSITCPFSEGELQWFGMDCVGRRADGGLTAAGTVPDFHGIPFTTNCGAKVRNIFESSKVRGQRSNGGDVTNGRSSWIERPFVGGRDCLRVSL